jgi:N-dimethylarginine dimethylaminohydrolase
MSLINQHVLMSDADYFADDQAINPYMVSQNPINIKTARAEHNLIRQAFIQAGIHVIQVPAPEACQDGVYTANWGLARGKKVILSSLPDPRRSEQAYARQVLQDLGKKTIEAPYRFSGQGDALPCGDRVFVGSHYRTDPRMHQFIADQLDYQVIGLRTVPLLDASGRPVTNKVSGWPDSFFYDLDLALGVLSPNLIAWCPQAFTPESQRVLQQLKIDKIEVSLEEAKEGFACNLVSTGEVVIMSGRATQLQAAIEAKGLKTITPEVSELAKGGGYIRCVSLTLD